MMVAISKRLVNYCKPFWFSLLSCSMKLFLPVISLLVCSSAMTQSYKQNIDFNKLSIQFEDASAQLKPEYIPYIYKLADSLVRTPELHVTIRGHVCCIKRNKLAKQRARVVRDYLLLFGVDNRQLTTIGMKNSMPIVFPEKTKQDELANMRVDFVLRRN